MAYLLPSEFATKMVDAGESKIYMSTRDTLIRAFMAGAILALAAVFAITIAVQTGVFLIGAPMGIVMLYQSLSIVATQFTHANIKLSKKVDHIISYILVSPDMHKIHHHYVLPYTDSNYGNIFSVWDRLFGTFMYMDREKLIYGVDVFPDEIANGKIGELLKQPFQKYQKPTIRPQD